MSGTSMSWSRRGVIAGLAGLASVGTSRVLRAAPSGAPIRVGQTLSLTGPFAQTGLVHKLTSEIFVAQLNAKDGLLGRPVEYVLLDDQSKPDVARTLYERLVTSDKVDFILGPYGTAAILAAMGVAQRYKKIFIQNTMGVPSMATYEWHFSALVSGDKPDKTLPELLYAAYDSTGHPPKSIAIVSNKYPSALFMASGTEKAFAAREVKVVAHLEYEVGNRDYGAIAARIKDANPDLLWVGCLGVEGNQILEALGQLQYKPPRHYYLYPSSGPLALLPAADGAVSLTNFEDVAPYNTTPVGAEFTRLFHEKALAASLPFPYADSQAANEYAGWQILTTAVEATKSLDDAKLAAWLNDATIDTIVGRRDFKGKWHTSSRDQEDLRQIQNGKWVAVWPKEHATPGVKLLAP
ncbi:MAG TPA: amino acid ABC transporter substrate-binding protein [Stellaceae bacterium]|nr:amino acid ABC transporter substrate-binding protein [Stellaceae bacterium]